MNIRKSNKYLCSHSLGQFRFEFQEPEHGKELRQSFQTSALGRWSLGHSRRGNGCERQRWAQRREVAALTPLMLSHGRFWNCGKLWNCTGPLSLFTILPLYS